jgi:Tol biopolymer transport system component
VTFDNAGVEGIEWSPDGRTLAFSSGRAGLYSLWTVPASGGAISWLAGGGSKLKHPTGVPKRNALAYENWIYEVNLWSVDGAGAATRITTSTDEWEYHPEVSPDGTRVAFVSTRSGSEEIWITGIDGRDPSQVTSFHGPRVATPRFSPDGRSLVFTARPDGRADVYVVELASRATRRVTDDPADDVTPSFTRDGASILFSSRRTGAWEVWRVPAAGGAATRLTTGGGSAPAEGPDGSVWFVRLGTRGLSRIPASGGAAVLAVPSLPAESYADWRLGKDGVLFKSGEVGDGSTISIAPYDGGEPRVFATLVNQAWPGFAVGPDGKTLVYGPSDRPYVALKMIENAC